MEAPQRHLVPGAEVEQRYWQNPPAVGAHEQAEALERTTSAVRARTQARLAQLELVGVLALVQLRPRFQ